MVLGGDVPVGCSSGRPPQDQVSLQPTPAGLEEVSKRNTAASHREETTREVEGCSFSGEMLLHSSCLSCAFFFTYRDFKNLATFEWYTFYQLSLSLCKFTPL